MGGGDGDADGLNPDGGAIPNMTVTAPRISAAGGTFIDPANFSFEPGAFATPIDFDIPMPEIYGLEDIEELKAEIREKLKEDLESEDRLGTADATRAPAAKFLTETVSNNPLAQALKLIAGKDRVERGIASFSDFVTPGTESAAGRAFNQAFSLGQPLMRGIRTLGTLAGFAYNPTMAAKSMAQNYALTRGISEVGARLDQSQNAFLRNVGSVFPRLTGNIWRDLGFYANGGEVSPSQDLLSAQEEYSQATSPYASLQDYLMNRPVYDRGEREAPQPFSMRTLAAPMPQDEDMAARRFEKIIEDQRAANEASQAERQAEINALRDLLREELASSEQAALAERSDLSKALEQRIVELQRGVDEETLDLRRAGLDERAELARQIEEGDRIVREAQQAAIGDLSDRQGSLIGDLKDRLASLSGDLAEIDAAIDQNYTQLDDRQKTYADATQDEISELNQQLESLYQNVDSGMASYSDDIRSDTADLVSGLESRIDALSENLGALPIAAIQAEIAAVNDQTATFQQAIDAAATERSDLAAQLQALSSAGLTQEDLSSLTQTIAGQRQQEIGSAIDPIQAQIEALRGQIPGEVDVEALRRQITEDVMAQMANQQPASPAPASPAPTGSAPTDGSSTDPAGSIDPYYGEGEIYSTSAAPYPVAVPASGAGQGQAASTNATLPPGVEEGGRYYTDPVTGNPMYQPPMPSYPPGTSGVQVMPTPIDLTTGQPRGFFLPGASGSNPVAPNRRKPVPVGPPTRIPDYIRRA